MSETYPNKGTRETLFAGHTPSSIGFDCKITTFFLIEQIKKAIYVRKHKWQYSIFFCLTSVSDDIVTRYASRLC